MTFTAYNTPGTYTNNADGQIYIGASGIDLTSDVASGDVIVNASDDNINITGSSQYIYSAQGASGTNSITMEGGINERYFGSESKDSVFMTGEIDEAFGGSVGGTYFLDGSDETFTGNSGNDLVTVESTGGTARGGYGNDTFKVYIATASTNVINGGFGNNTLTLSDVSGDSSAITFDLAKDTETGLNNLSFSNIQNVNYSIADNGPNRSANATFTTEEGTNTFSFAYSSATNTVFNTGGTDTVSGGPGTQIVVGGTGATTLGANNGTDYLYGSTGTSELTAIGSTSGTARLYGGSGTDELLGYLSLTQPPINGFPQPPITVSGTGNEYFYGGSGTETFVAGGGNNVFVEGIGNNTFTGSTGMDFIYGSSGGSKVYGGSGSDFVYTGTQAQYFYSGSGKEYFEVMQGTQANGKLDVVDNFQTQSAGGKGTFVFMPSYEASSTSFVQGQGGVYIQTNLGGGQASDILVANTNNVAAVKAQTFFNL